MKIFAVLASGLLSAGLLSGVPASAAADGVVIRTVHRAYGDGPVRLGSADVLKIRFDGKRGDRVRLGNTNCPVSLRGPGNVKVSELPEGFWRLEEGGRHTFALTRCNRLNGSSRVQLEKLRFAPVVTNGEGTRLRDHRGFVDAVRVTVPESGRLQVTGQDIAPGTYSPFDGMVLPNGAWKQVGGDTFFFEAGRAISGDIGPLHAADGGALVSQAGDRVTLIATVPVTVWTSISQVVPVTVDAATATLLPIPEVRYREYQLEFDAVAGAWIHAEALGFGPTEWLMRLIGPNGEVFHRPTFWHIAEAGRYRLLISTQNMVQAGQVRLRAITQVHATMPVDGTHLTLTADEPGEWVLARMTLPEDGNTFYRMHVHSFTATGAWSALATAEEELDCSRSRANGCGDYSYGAVWPRYPTSWPFGLSSGLPNPWFVLLGPAPGVIASVELSVSPSTFPFSRPARPSAG